MGVISLNITNRLFWLGRYSERVYTTLSYMLRRYDELIDGANAFDFRDYCVKLGIFADYQSPQDFFRRYLFDRSDANSIASCAGQMLGNGTTLRETIHSPTLSYLQMACTAIELAEKSSGPCVELQWALDDIMAFRGSFDDSIDDEDTRNIIKCGSGMERISLYLRLSFDGESTKREIHKLLNRLYKTHLATDPQALSALTDAAFGQKEISGSQLVRSVESLFVVS